MNIESELVKIIQGTLQNTNKTSAYDTSAEVRRIDEENGLAWVHIAGGVDETPVRMTMNAKEGDNVQVRVANGTAFLIGNATSPPTDDTQANVARRVATQAIDKASDAIDSATTAQIAAERAVNDAETARIAALQASEDAERAETAANTAQTSADNAARSAVVANQNAQKAYDAANASMIQLGMVEDVVGALNWISSHATYQKSEDLSVMQNKFYFKLTGTAVENPVGSPINNGYYELVDGSFVVSEDSAVDTAKTYYTVLAVSTTPVKSPADEGAYEVRDLSEGVSQYISSHLALDESGLHVVNGSSRIDLSPNGGIDIWSNTAKIAHYGSDAQLGDANGYHIDIQSGENARLSFKNHETEIAYMSKDMLYIPRAVVVDSMQVGDEANGGAWKWVIDPSSRSLTLSWIGGGA